MQSRNGFRPSAWDALEERLVLSSSFLDPFGLWSDVATAIDPPKPSTGKTVTVGALGDSYTDEYKFYSPDRSQARNWVEVLADTHRVNFGAFTNKSRGAPRDQGFAFNWAQSGATSNDMVQDQLPGLSAQVAKGQVKYVTIFIGGDDFLDFAQAVRNGQIPAAQVSSALSQVTAQLEQNFTTAVNTLLAANPHVKLLVATLPDVTIQPVFQSASSTPQGQALVAALNAATAQYNALITSTATGNDRIALVDLAGEAAQLSQETGTSGTFSYGGTTINLNTPGDSYHDFFLADDIHVGTVVQGVIANDFVNALDSKFHAGVAPLSPQKIVQFAKHVRPNTR